MRVITMCNQKGGVGKTTTAFHLCRAAVLAGQRVLGVDMDPQSNFTMIGAREDVQDDDLSIADVLSARTQTPAAEVIVPGRWPGFSLLPAIEDPLGVVGDELVVRGAGREGLLRAALEPLAAEYDLVVIDTPPDVSQLTINALAASDAAVIITHSKLFSTKGVGGILRTIETVRAHYQPGLVLAGVIVNQHERTTIHGRARLDELHDAVTVLEPPVPKLTVINDAAEACVGLDEWGTAQARSMATIYATYLHQIEGALA